ncbi:TonB-dependent receptor [Mangrovibacterium diazotrophicum]|uniref:Iron complex outermembrane receptor protein n=1 Tax=Mangrovibacterium diazotrophicum TaxID=1261403 RepID=A0A419VYT3_9BACT|nr:TonB-dependent receptor [Mangrovibacterium diazotrophicum]RKD88220.1 iron complex outermembrane receptor protein [Mangrovibacterium diazotrophicum]
MKKLFNKHNRAEVLCFRRWNGHGYSLFQAIKRQVRIASLVVAYLYVSLPQEAVAQTDTLKLSTDYNLDEIEVSAQRAPVTYSQAARIISVIEREQIEAAPVSSIQDLLEYALGVDIRQRGTYGVQADVSVRGGSFDQTLILLNGINISDPQTGHHNLNVPVSLKSIKRIEILNGPSARVYGPNAFSGAINIVTEPDDDEALRMDVAFGDHGLRDLNASANVKTGKLTSFIAASNMASNGYISNTDFDIYNIFYQGRLKTEPGTLDFQVGYTDKGFGANSFYTPKYPNQYEATKTTFASVKMETGKTLHFTPAAYWRRHQDRFELFRDNPASWYSGHNYHMTDVFGLSLNSWFQSDLGKTAFGAEFRSENILSNVLGEDLDDSIKVPGESGQYFYKGHSRTIISYFAEHTFYVGNLTASLGAMANWISDLHNEWNVYPGIDLSYKFSDQFKAFGSFNKSLRMPTFTDLYYSGPTNQGNPDLKPERSTTYEAGLKYRTPALNAEAAWYHRIGKDMIDWVRLTDAELWQTANLTEIKSDGLEVNADLNFGAIAGPSFFIKHFGVNYAYNSLDKGSSNYLSNYVLDNLKHKIVFSLDHSIWQNIYAGWKVRFQDRNGSYAKYEDTVYIGESDYEPFWLADLKVYYKNETTQVYLSVSNLFDKSYIDIGNISQPGRWISAGISYQLNFNK